MHSCDFLRFIILIPIGHIYVCTHYLLKLIWRRVLSDIEVVAVTVLLFEVFTVVEFRQVSILLLPFPGPVAELLASEFVFNVLPFEVVLLLE